MSRFIWCAVVTAVLALPALGQSVPANQQPPRSDSEQRKPKAPTTEPSELPSRLPASAPDPGESSSKSTRVDLSPPAGETGLDLSSGSNAEVRELKPWDPHKAEKNVEVGDYYFKRKNYSAALSRYREALYWKSEDAIASFRLAQTLEQIGQYREARSFYQAYLKVLPKGEFAKQASEGLARVKDKPDDPTKAPAGPPQL